MIAALSVPTHLSCSACGLQPSTHGVQIDGKTAGGICAGCELVIRQGEHAGLGGIKHWKDRLKNVEKRWLDAIKNMHDLEQILKDDAEIIRPQITGNQGN